MTRKRQAITSGRIFVRIAQYGVLSLALLVALGPVLWAVLSSFKTSTQILTNVFGLPLPPTLDGYRDAITQVNLLSYVGNTALYAVSAAVLCPLVALMIAYPCTRMRFPFRKAISVAIASGLAVPIVCLITPEFFIMLRTGLLDTKVGMVVFYTAIFMPLAFVILRANLLSIPKEVEEAAALDGASYYRTLFRIVAPMAMPAIATVSILVFIFVWNDFLWNLILAPGFDNRNTQVVLSTFRGQFQFNVAGLLAGATIVLVVPLLLFLFTQRYAIAGLAGATASSARARERK